MKRDYWEFVKLMASREYQKRGAFVGVVYFSETELRFIRLLVWLGLDFLAQRLVWRAINRASNDYTG